MDSVLAESDGLTEDRGFTVCVSGTDRRLPEGSCLVGMESFLGKMKTFATKSTFSFI